MTEQPQREVPEPAPDEPLDGGRSARLPGFILAFIAVLVAADIASDLHDGADLAHVALELVVFALAAGGALLLWWQLRAARRRNRVLRADLSAARADLERFREESQDAMRGLGAAIDRQFERWSLSPAEREVALLLLKGLSHKDAAEVRQTSERTVRQQALGVYRKAGLAGRAELSAFFLEDLLLPSTALAAAER